MSQSETDQTPTACKPTPSPGKKAWKIVAALVLLRLCVGWHFFSEGTKKLAYDRGQNEWRLDFSAEGFLSQAKGPLAGLFQSQLPGRHGWQSLLAVPKQARPLDTKQLYERVDWLDGYKQRRAQAAKEKRPLPIELPPFAPYRDWATRVVDDWRAKLKAFTDLDMLGETQREQAAERFQVRHQQLADYLAGELEAIEDYQHDLWRLEQKKAMAGADEIPFRQQRIAVKQAEVARLPSKWLAAVRSFEQGLVDDLRGIAASGDSDASIQEAAESVLTSAKQKRMRLLSLVVTCTVTGVGVCLLLGFFTRLASVVGALFLLSVIATQPPWVAGAAPTMNQTVELAALLLLAATAAGRWAGLDFFTHALCQKCCGTKKA